jgi:hypothetical protein
LDERGPQSYVQGVHEAAVERVLAEQRRYYRERAPEYDDWWFRRGAYRSRLFDQSWELVGRALKPEGRVSLVDNARLGIARYREGERGRRGRPASPLGMVASSISSSACGSRRTSSARPRRSVGG